MREGAVLLRMLLVAALALVAGAAAAADFKIQAWSFDMDAPGSLPSGFAAGNRNGASGRWEVKADPQSSSPPHVLARIPLGSSDMGPQVIFLDGIEATNLDMTVRIKAVSSEDGQGGGVVFRAEDERNYYVVWISLQEKLIRIDRIVNGEVKPLQDLSVGTLEAGKWHTLRLTIRSSELEAIFDNRHLISAREKAWEFGR